MGARDESGGTPIGRSTTTISIAQTAPIRIHHLTEVLCEDPAALRRALPRAASEALRLASGRSADAAAIERALAGEPSVTGPLLSIAASGLFARSPGGASGTFPDVRGVVMQLGLEATRDVLLMVVTNGIAARVPRFEAYAETLRRRALAAGLAARLISRALHVETSHDFLVGLLHDVGELVLLQRAAEEGILPAGVLDEPEGAVILEAIDNDHTRVGGAVCRAWGLPPAIAEAAELHHDRRAGRRGRLPSQLAAAADVVATRVTARGDDVARASIFSEIGLSPNATAQVIADVEAILPALAVAGTAAQR
ncbi:MAG TPA: HDOD domain-containing protein [Polyangia bacterium]|nr:HDOD domain-containing protein [Polyangia bacterium]